MVYLACAKCEKLESNEPFLMGGDMMICACRELARARELLKRARERQASSTQRVWMKSAMVEREHGDLRGCSHPEN